jgi:nucleoside-diphosphate-sugar epimerase
MKVLVTGAFEDRAGFGEALVGDLLQLGVQVGTLNREDPEARQRANPWNGFIGQVWTRSWNSGAMDHALRHVDVVIHCSEMSPPHSEAAPKEAQTRNVEATRELIAACMRRPEPTRWILVSSIAVSGSSQEYPAPRCASDPVAPVSHYAKQRLECEQLLVDSGIDCCVLRLAPMQPPRLELRDVAALRRFFAHGLENRIELVHPKDAALAVVHALESESVWGNTLLIGGGRSCQLRSRDVNRAILRALGLVEFSDAAFGKEEDENDWLDTEESEGLLQYQQRSADELFEEWEEQESQRRARIKWVRPIYLSLLLRHSRQK